MLHIHIAPCHAARASHLCSPNVNIATMASRRAFFRVFILALAQQFSLEHACLVDQRLSREAKRRPRRVWMRRWLQRKDSSLYQTWVTEVALEDPAEFTSYHRWLICILFIDLTYLSIISNWNIQLTQRNYLQRVTKAGFNDILNLIGPSIRKRNTNFRTAIPIDQRLSITLHYLASGLYFIMNWLYILCCNHSPLDRRFVLINVLIFNICSSRC